MFSSTIIPTINRPSLTTSVYSALDQCNSSESEIIVVNDGGKPLPDMAWMCQPNVLIINTQRRERSVARNTGAALARGRYLHFLDDDDILVPGALDAIRALAGQSPDAVWLYGAYNSVTDEGACIEHFAPDVKGNIFGLLLAGEAIPLQTSFIRADAFFAAGGFDPRLTGPEDRDLGRRVALQGAWAGTTTTVAHIRVGAAASSTPNARLSTAKAQARAAGNNDQRGRENALNDPSAIKFAVRSAQSPLLRGRVSRAYVGSSIWNFKRRRVLVAMSRVLGAVAVARAAVVTPQFWRGLARRRQS